MVAVPFVRIGGGWGELNGKKILLRNGGTAAHQVVVLKVR